VTGQILTIFETNKTFNMTLGKIKFIGFILLQLSLSSCEKTENLRKAEQPLNVLMIFVDDLRPELGCYGNKIIKSPNIDKLASEGIMFTNHFVQVPTCGASRYSMLTGTRPVSPDFLGNYIQFNSSPDKPETFIHHLKNNGYYTVGIGKISHSADGLIYGYTDPVSDIKELPLSFDEFVFNAGKWKTGWNAFFAYANGENRQSMKRQVKPYEAADVTDEGYPDGLTANLAISKLKELKDKAKPFFLGVGFFKPHLPFNAPKKYWDMYNREDILLTQAPYIPKNINTVSLHNSGEFNGYLLTDENATLDTPLSDDYARKVKHAYYASVSYVDAQIGKVINELKRLELDNNTIVILWGDHGWHLGDQRVWGKHTLFEKALKSALIIKTPFVKEKGFRAVGIVESIDLYPTILDLCGIDPVKGIQGKSLMQQLESPTAKGKEAAYSYFKNGITMRTNKYRLTKYFRTEVPTIELYDLVNDPEETINIALNDPEIIEELMPLWEQGNTGLYDQEP
jgi:arylsulfatase A-like enzyme